MRLEMYDKCELADGRCGWIIEILEEGKAYMVEIDKKGMEDRIVTVKPEEIIRKVA